ncbi:MAG: hypothetical protein OHK93_002706 [Ramalina farinacea]|uniref:Uncharacterized protein n=1 Tax=Ramalina farinacea TaxID=258253 RepID=A0AA43QSP7_9LECA|nr:hypothetical protein [Ramalina farinacea]
MAQNPMFKFFMAALALSFTCIMIRCIYRIVELAPGWGSAQMSNETNFIACEGAMIVVAVVVLNLFFPGQYLTKRFAMELSSKHSNSSSMSSTPLEKPVKV